MELEYLQTQRYEYIIDAVCTDVMKHKILSLYRLPHTDRQSERYPSNAILLRVRPRRAAPARIRYVELANAPPGRSNTEDIPTGAPSHRYI
ncbi:hypothetical protein EVAR_96960_1 [Eumeta japonica]|uniref:Uncharacterized protein n=1 Tax=Eumeta variegata TaxID=151549 RepID=A0A4C1VFC0_EUMVA|nr:hypothetical protein EVAR_96960_1 [Eumeta japonica]